MSKNDLVKSPDLAATPSAVTTSPSRMNVWGVVLAGGEGVRLRPLVRRLVGEDRPKQYVKLLGSRTLLRQTLDRVALGIPIARTAVVTVTGHAGYIGEELAGHERPHVFAQPANRGTAAAILYAAHWIASRDADATVVVFPSDHLVLSEMRFIAHVAEVAAWVERQSERVVLLGAQPRSPEVDYGWIEPGEPVGQISTGAVSAVRRFWEKPSVAQARINLMSGHLWNTSVIIGKASAFCLVGSRWVPQMSERLARAACFVDTPHERAALHQAYELMGKASFSRAILERAPASVAVSRLPRMTWSDLGSPRRVMDALAGLEARTARVGAAGLGADQVDAGSGASRERSVLSSARSSGSTGTC
jgi:mannose-1-phosphate guanylyltransferase